MKLDEPEPAEGQYAPEVDPDRLADLRLRLFDSQERARAARAALGLAVGELALMRRLAKFAAEGASPPRSAKVGEVPLLAAMPVLAAPRYHLDVCENRGTFTYIAGWAFHPSSSWNARDAETSLLFRHGDDSYHVTTGKLLRLDVAAHFAAQASQASGGAHGLEGVGFACEVLHESLPAGKDWEIALRLRCGTLMCEGSTGWTLRL